MTSEFPQQVETQKHKIWFRLLPLAMMDRYILGAMFWPFVFGVAAFTGIGLSVGTLFDLMRKVTESDLAIATACQILAWQIPGYVVLALPMSTLFTTLMIYSRLSGDSEIVALQSCGVSLYRLVAPAILFSVLVMTLTFMGSEFVTPTTNYQATTTLKQSLHQERPTFQKENIVYQEFTGGMLSKMFFAHRFDGTYMRDLSVLSFAQGRLSQIVAAESAVWRPEPAAWDFFRGTIYELGGNESYENVVRFEQQQLRLPRAPLDLATQRRKPDQMNIAQTQQFLKLVTSSGDTKRIRRLQVELQQKYAFPSVCVVFGLVGAVLGIRPPRTSTSRGFGVSIVVIFSYYLLAFITNSLGTAGILSPVAGAWLPTLMGLLVGGLLLI